MKFALAALLALAFGAASASAEDSKDRLTFRFDKDSFFESYPTLSLEHRLGESNSLTASVVDYLAWSSFELDFGWNHYVGNWTIYPGLGATSGPRFWGLAADKTNFLARELVPQFGLYYSSPNWEAELYQGAWIPTGQESYDTALWYTQTRWWVAAKKNGWGLGPQLETFGTKEGKNDLRLTHLWLGAHMLKDLPKGSFQLFLGYDTISLDNYVGSPKKAGAVFQVTVIVPLY